MVKEHMVTHHSHHHHSCHASGAAWRLSAAFGLSVVYMLMEIAGSYLSGSLALLADAGHMLVHNGALLIAIVAAYVAQRQPDEKYAFGYGRIEAIGGFLNALLLLGVGITLAFHGAERLHEHHHHTVEASIMGAVAFAGILMHALSAWILYRGRRESLNVYGAFLHLLVDLAATLLALGTSFAISLTRWDCLDSAASLLIVAFIILSAANLLRRSFHVLMDRTPDNVDIKAMKKALCAIPHVQDVHHILIRTLRAGDMYLSAHLVVEQTCMDAEHWMACRKKAQDILAADFGIHHTLLQVEPMESDADDHHAHDHDHGHHHH
ncbi:MAG: cation diffusion facilitator family transporter [Proteobacteria bacterium]|nr:cation diffusion facilitator family transporter [Pseudomonadota bacterium]